MTAGQTDSAGHVPPLIQGGCRGDGTPDAAWRIVLANLALAYKLAARFAVGSKISPDDLRQQAVFALHHAAVTFDAGRGAAFSTHAWTVITRALATLVRNDATRRRNLPSVGGASLHLLAAPVRAASLGLPDLAILDARERYVIHRLFGLSGCERATLREIAADLGVCHKTVGRIRDQALDRLRLDCGLPAKEAA
jgi:DNA-directed RNA polymerase specialized sigma subunit